MLIFNRFFAALFFISILVSTSFASQPLKWYDFDEGMAKAKKENKILLVDFYTDWCGWCKKMDKATYEDERVIKMLNEKFIVVKLNPEKSAPINYNGEKVGAAEFSSAAGVSGYPATGFFTNSSELMGVVSGYYPPEDFMALLTKVSATVN